MDGLRVLLGCSSSDASVLCETVEGYGCSVEEAASSSAVMERAQADPHWNAIFIDAKLPDAGSFAACRELTENTATCHMPVIMVVFGDEPVNYAKRCDDAGALAWLPSGFSPSEVRLILHIVRQLAGAPDEEAGGALDSAFVERVSQLSHAVNNPLQALFASGDLLMLELDGQENPAGLVQDMLANAQRVADLVSAVSIEAKQLGGNDS